MNDINWMNEGTEADRIERAIRWYKLMNLERAARQYTSNPLFTNAAFIPWTRWHEAGQDWLAGPLIAAKFRGRRGCDEIVRKDR